MPLPIAPPAPALVAALAAPTAGERGNQALVATAVTGAEKAGAGAAQAETTVREIVSLSGRRPEAGDTVFAAPFAEIWRDGRKLAEVDARGQVHGLAGLVLDLPGGGGGMALAAMRAAALAQSLGGEIRSAGQLTDGRTLAMRGRLQAAYAL